ncbi:NAD-dependent dehydratase [Stenotrophomonas sp. CFBP8980]|uniref:NAD-dependent dehydratase n=1 Tax=Stenotrophomonas sp. CFBP8980 TaxID=3096523 RepID=UPI002A6A7460|nr:NAD-dependent dehydratase [Stenotrophomonas sp. CFBP8980]MDY1032317.1 NAD-dependent dehydratase [Stenotrophomonas sp. CFBP8980]
MRVMLLGATGLVGGQVLALMLEDMRCTELVAPSRRPLPVTAPKLDNPVLDFEHLPGTAPWWAVDAVICALGSTMAQAGSREAFKRIDHDYPLTFAGQAHAHGAGTFVLNSAAGADAGSRIFYNRVKGALEQDLRGLDFDSLTLVRPGLIGGQRAHKRTGEHLALQVLGVLGPLLPRGWRINPAENIAAALVDAALEPLPGEHVVSAAQLA